MQLTLTIDPSWIGYPDALAEVLKRIRALERPAPASSPPAAAPAREPGEDPIEPEHAATATNGNGNGRHAQSPLAPPRDGRELYRWLKVQDEHHDYGLVKYLSQWGKAQEFPRRIVDWDGEQTTRGYSAACKQVRTLVSA